MNRIEPNILLAVSTGVAFILLLMTASAFGEPGNAMKYVVIAVICTGLFVACNGMMSRLMKREAPRPMIAPGAPAMTVFAGAFPLVAIIAAAAPVFWPGRDYGLLVIIIAVWFGVTVDSAIRANRT